MSYIQFKEINKVYNNGFHAVKDFSLEIEKGEFIVFVGPSGCGKTTTLRMLAGLEEITTGELLINGVVVNDVEPKDRDIAMVFQNYALYPHMTVYDNMVYGLKFKKVPKEEQKRRVYEAIEILGFDPEYLKRRPAQLSGGQKQRVALGRTIVRQANVFLMDEPLSNLDAKLRVQMRSEITRIHDNVKSTTIYVTHDQVEAMTMADRIVVMNDGRIQQIGTPEGIYDYPENVFVAGFMGAPSMNFITGIYENGYVKFSNDRKIEMNKDKLTVYKEYNGREVIFGIRPEDCYIEDALVSSTYPHSVMEATVNNIELLGYEKVIYLDSFGDKIIGKIDARNKINKNQSVKVAFDMNRAHLFDKETTLRIK